MNELWRRIKDRDLESKFKWSIIDRWPLHSGFIEAVTERVLERFGDFAPADQHKVVIVFSAHSVPIRW